MKKERTIMNKVILNRFLLLCLFLISINVQTQNSKIDSLINNELLTFKLSVDKKRLVSLEIENTTCDTIILSTRLCVEDNNCLAYIVGYKKNIKNGNVYYEKGVLWDYYKYGIEKFLKLFPTERLSAIQIFPKTKIKTPLTHFNKGKYFFKIQTAYVYRKKTYFIRTETNKIKVK